MMMGSGLRRRLIWLMTARVIVSTLLLGSAILFQISAPGTLPGDPFFLLIAFTYALTGLFAATLSHAERHPWLIALQLAADVGIVSAFIFLTGGISSYFALLYVLPIVGGSALLPRWGGTWVAVLSGVLYGALVSTQYLSEAGVIGPAWLGTAYPLLPPPRVAQYTVVTNVVAFLLVAVLSGSLAERLRAADRRLAQASTAIADLKAFNQHVIDSLTSGLATCDRTGRLLTFNRAAETIVGHAAGAVVGRVAWEVLQLPDAFVAQLSGGSERPASRRVDYAYRCGDGRLKEIGLSAAPLATPDGLSGFLLTFQDITEIRRLEREGRRRQRLAAVGEMAAGIAHEIRNPLASLLGSIQILRQELSLTEEQAQLMDIVLRESERLNETIRSFLDYARPQRAAATTVDVGRVLHDTAALLRNSPDLHEAHEIIVDATPGEVWYDTDEHQVRQIVWNLATNGLRAMPTGGRLRLAARTDAPAGIERGHLVLTVEDQGVGMTPDALDGIFQPFRGTFPKGTGLGLAIVHRIVSDHDGEIEVRSTPGQGTVVTVRLPLTLTTDGSRGQGPGARGQAGASQAGAKDQRPSGR
jgi:two-component system, NtrC family, sensor histidine kinase PilS